LSAGRDDDVVPADARPAHGSPGERGWSPSALTVVGVTALIALGLALFNFVYYGYFVDSEAFLQQKEAQARAEAEALYRKRQAELKAEADAAGAKLDKLPVEPPPFRLVAQRAGPAVVNISNQRLIQQGRDRQGKPITRYRQESEGSGVLVRIDEAKRGYVLTNFHVVDKADRIGLNFAAGQTFNVTVSNQTVFIDRETDLAVVQFDAKTFDHAVIAEFGDSNRLEVGDWVIAIGSPFGLKQTVTTGIVSAKGRADLGILDDVELIQTDAAINLGNSGGPLLDLHGRVIGINNAIFTTTKGNQGIGFAIPGNVAKQVMEQLVKPPHRVTNRGFVGVNMRDLRPFELDQLQVESGVLVTRVVSGGPADRAGIEPDDVLAAFNGTRIQQVTQLRRMIGDTPPGTQVRLEVVRPGETQNRFTVQLTLIPRPWLEANPILRP
jgi:serine protease Do